MLCSAMKNPTYNHRGNKFRPTLAETFSSFIRNCGSPQHGFGFASITVLPVGVCQLFCLLLYPFLQRQEVAFPYCSTSQKVICNCTSGIHIHVLLRVIYYALSLSYDENKVSFWRLLVPLCVKNNHLLLLQLLCQPFFLRVLLFSVNIII